MSAASAPARPAVPRRAMFAYLVAVLAVLIDQASKAWVLYGARLQEGVPLPVVAPLRFSLTWNKGFSFGLLSTSPFARWGLFAFSLVIVAFLADWARRTTRGLTVLALGLIMGGAIGNALDRLRLGAVVDFIDVAQLGFFPWIFNVADSAITVGVVLLLLDSLFAPRPAPSA